MNSTERGPLMPRHGSARLPTLDLGAHAASERYALPLACAVRAVRPDWQLQQQTHPPATANRTARG